LRKAPKSGALPGNQATGGRIVVQNAHTLDAVDLRLLEALQTDCTRSCEDLAELAGASRSSVQRRINRLRRAGVIEAECAQLSPNALGLSMAFVVAVTLERETTQITQDFMDKVKSADVVQQCYYVTGEADFIVVLNVRDMQEYTAVIEELFVGNPSVRRFQTNVVIERVKSGLRLPLKTIARS
jgi:DNA-binding Lrp family transcriptional regulator